MYDRTISIYLKMIKVHGVTITCFKVKLREMHHLRYNVKQLMKKYRIVSIKVFNNVT